jgi:hypothetical protein
VTGRIRAALATLAAASVIGSSACTLLASPTPSASAAPTARPTPTATVAATPSESASAVPTATNDASPSPTPEPPLSLALPEERDDRALRVAVAPDVAPGGDGLIVVTITNLADTRIDEIVLRWSADLEQTLSLAPFQPTADRIRDGGPPLVQDWTKWVAGPGERGEPAGTISLGYGPMDPGMSLEIALFVSRAAVGSVAFDLQLLAGEALLVLEGGAPAELRVEVP